MYTYEALAVYTNKHGTKWYSMEFDAPNDQFAVATAPWRIGNEFGIITNRIRLCACYDTGRRRVVSDEI